MASASRSRSFRRLRSSSRCPGRRAVVLTIGAIAFAAGLITGSGAGRSRSHAGDHPDGVRARIPATNVSSARARSRRCFAAGGSRLHGLSRSLVTAVTDASAARLVRSRIDSRIFRSICARSPRLRSRRRSRGGLRRGDPPASGARRTIAIGPRAAARSRATPASALRLAATIGILLDALRRAGCGAMRRRRDPRKRRAARDAARARRRALRAGALDLAASEPRTPDAPARPTLPPDHQLASTRCEREAARLDRRRRSRRRRARRDRRARAPARSRARPTSGGSRRRSADDQTAATAIGDVNLAAFIPTRVVRPARVQAAFDAGFAGASLSRRDCRWR